MRLPRKIKGNGEGVPIVALDVDGTLGNYHKHFLSFAENWFGREMPDPLDINPGMELYRFMGVTLTQYREAKLAFRQGGWKRWMPVYPGASELTLAIQEAGAEVWICTTRPYLRLDNIDPDTREWLDRNGIMYNAVLFGDQKYTELKRQAYKRVAAVLDDMPKMTWQAFRLGFAPVYLMDQPYNRDTLDHAWRVKSLPEAQEAILKNIAHWKDTQK